MELQPKLRIQPLWAHLGDVTDLLLSLGFPEEKLVSKLLILIALVCLEICSALLWIQPGTMRPGAKQWHCKSLPFLILHSDFLFLNPNVPTVGFFLP